MILDLWHTFVDWLTSEGGQTILTTVFLPFAAILTAGLLAVLIARASSTRLMKHRDREEKAAAIAGLLAVTRRTPVWTSLTMAEKDHLDYQITESAVRLRLLPIPGADLAAEWAQLRVSAIKRHSAALIDEAEKELALLEDGLILWHRKPGQARKQFKTEISYLRLDERSVDHDLLARQKQWQAQQSGKTGQVTPMVPAVQPAATTTPVKPAQPAAAPSASAAPASASDDAPAVVVSPGNARVSADELSELIANSQKQAS